MALSDILETLNADPSVRRRLQFADTIVGIDNGRETWMLILKDGKIDTACDDAKANISIRIAPEAWAAFQQPVPPPGCHDIYAMAETGHAEVTGNFLAMFHYSFVLKDILQQLATGRMFG